jgi:hypothetical protein
MLLALLALCATANAQDRKGNPAMPCYRALADDPRFAPIRDKVILGPATAADTQRVARIAERASEAERPAIAAWRAAREDCHRLEKPYFATRDNQIQATAHRYFASLQSLIRELEAGKLSYGEFGTRRLALFDRFNRDIEEIRRSILPPKLPPPPGKA